MGVIEQLAQARTPDRRIASPPDAKNKFRRSGRWFIAVTVSLGVATGVLFGSGAPALGAADEAVFGTATPATPSDSDRNAVTVGLRFTTKTAGSITAVRFFKGAGNGGTHVGAVYSSGGTLLARATFRDEGASGWQSVRLASPIAANAGASYTAAVLMPVGRYGVTDPYPWPADRASLTGRSGTYSYGTSLRYPHQTFQKSNYFVDIFFTPRPTSPPSPTTTPTATATPTPTTAPTATATPTNPTTGAFPDASNTGVPAGVTLTNYTGPAVITTAGTVIDAKVVTSCLVIKANNVVIRNSRIQSRGCFFNVLSDNGNTGLTLTDVEIDGLNNTTGDSAINGGGFTCLRCDIRGTVDGIKAQSNVVVKDSYIHDLAQGNDSHNDGIQSLGTTSLRILHNSMVIADGSTSAIILSTGSSSNMRNVQIDGNLLGGGAYTVYGGYQSGIDVLSRVSNIAITNNRFTTTIHPRSGAYGPLTSVDSPVVVSGNTWYDGPNAGKIVS